MRLFILLGLIGLSLFFGTSTASAASCYNLFQNAEHKQERTILVYVQKCVIEKADAFVSSDAYSVHLEYLYYFLKQVKGKNYAGFSLNTTKKLEALMLKVRNLHLCVKGHKKFCVSKKKRRFQQLEKLMDKACEQGSSLCDYYGDKLKERISKWDFPPFTE